MTVEAEDLLVDLGEFPFELTSEEFASACRRAYLRIVIGAQNGWGKAELAKWLAGPYRRLTQRPSWALEGDDAAVDRRIEEPITDVTPTPPSGVGVSETRIEQILADMHMDVMLVMQELMTPAGRSAFATLAVDLPLVVLGRDAAGARVALPLTRERMSLVDRVLSLVAVDALSRSEDFEHSLFVCARCGQLVFDVYARSQGVCRIHVSGVTRR